MVRMLTARQPTIAALFFVAGAVCSAQQPAPEHVTVPFSDPSRPGSLKIAVISGGITIRGENRRDVSIDVRHRSDTPGRPRETSDGLRRLTPTGGFQVIEEQNEMTISGLNRALDFDIRVPSRTSLRVNTVNGGGIVIDAIEGEIETNNTNGPITLTNIAGPVVANSTNGKVVAAFTSVTSGKAMAFTSLNGAVDVTLPASTKADLKLLSDRGDVYTDFDVQLRPATPPKPDDTGRSNGRYRLNVNRVISGTINGGGAEFELRTFNGNVYLRKAK